ncbi:MAG: hypothetical protein ABIE70_04280 [bacterium]
MKKRTAIGITLGVAGAVVVVVATYGMILLGEPNARYVRVLLWAFFIAFAVVVGLIEGSKHGWFDPKTEARNKRWRELKKQNKP